MKQLGILDAAFINLEQTNTPQHVGGLGIYDPSTAPGGFVRFPPEDLHRRRIRFAATFWPPDFPRLVATLAGSSFSWLMQKKGKKMPEVSGKSL